MIPPIVSRPNGTVHGAEQAQIGQLLNRAVLKKQVPGKTVDSVGPVAVALDNVSQGRSGYASRAGCVPLYVSVPAQHRSWRNLEGMKADYVTDGVVHVSR